MKRKSFLKNTILISGFAVSAVILSAQVNKSKRIEAASEPQNAKSIAHDAARSEDDAEGLAELGKISRRYENKNLYLSGELLFYANADSMMAAPQRVQFTSINTPQGTSYEIDSVQTIVSESMTLLVDKKEKSILMIEKNAGAGQRNFHKIISDELSQFREYISSIKVITHGKDKKLVITFKDDSPANTSNYEIVYDPGTYRIKRVRMEIVDGEITDNSQGQDADDELVLDDQSNTEIPTGYYAKTKTSVYEVIYKVEKTADPDFVNINHFVKKNTGGYTPTGAYKNFELLN